MIKPDIPVNEHERLLAVRDCHILDTEYEKEYDDITRMASEICELPYSLITIVDENRQWFPVQRSRRARQRQVRRSCCPCWRFSRYTVLYHSPRRQLHRRIAGAGGENRISASISRHGSFFNDE